MIRLKSVEIDGFITPTQKVKLDFVDSNVICIYGDNGSGKTTFLEILYAVFDRDEDILERHSLNRVKIDYISNETIETVRIFEDENGIKEDREVGINHDSNKYNFLDLNNSNLNNITSLFLGIGRGIHKQDFKIPRSLIWSFFNAKRTDDEGKKVLTGYQIDEFTDKLLEWITPESIIQEDIKEKDNKKNIYLQNITIDRVEALLISKYKEAVLDAKAKIEKALSKTSLNFLKNTTDKRVEIDLEDLRERLIYNRILLLEMFSKDEEIGITALLDSVDRDSNYLKTVSSSQHIILKTIVDKLQSEVELFKGIQTFLDEYNSFLNYDKKLVLSSNGIFVTPENHSIEKLSSGERHLLTFLATILLLGEEQDFILLDEPEISLDVNWIEKLLPIISKLAPDSQIIVATHNLTILGDYFDESTEMKFERK